MRLVFAILAALASPQLAAAQGQAPLVQFPGKWAAQPNAGELEAARPANRSGRGYVDLFCGVDSQGGIGSCTITSEAPANMGFGKAALGLAPRYRLSMEGLATPSTPLSVHIWVAWPGDSGPCYPPNCTGIPAPAR